jgi:hypothetical protein
VEKEAPTPKIKISGTKDSPVGRAKLEALVDVWLEIVRAKKREEKNEQHSNIPKN